MGGSSLSNPSCFLVVDKKNMTWQFKAANEKSKHILDMSNTPAHEMGYIENIFSY